MWLLAEMETTSSPDTLPLRPTSVHDLAQRMTCPDTDPKERKALEALAKWLVHVFRDNPQLSYLDDIAILSPIVSAESFKDVITAFANKIIEGTKDRKIVDTQLDLHLATVLRCHGTKPKGVLGPLLDSLQTRLEAAVEQAEPETQYHLLCALSVVLDAMVDAEASGISRESLQEPLLKHLKTLSESQELRLSQAAGYTWQALLCIPNDETPYQALLRTALDFAQTSSKVAGAAPTMDLSKLHDGVLGLGKVPELIKAMIDVVQAIGELHGVAESAMQAFDKQATWYSSLHFADLLIYKKNYAGLGDFIRDIPCGKEKEFLCGLFAKLETAWFSGGTNADAEAIVYFIDENLVKEASSSKHQRVREWLKAVSITLHKPEWPLATSRTTSGCFNFLRRSDYSADIECIRLQREGAAGQLLERAWRECPEAKLFYADVCIRRYYEDGQRLEVERLSGQLVPMEQCYINLIIKKHKKGASLGDPIIAEHKEKTSFADPQDGARLNPEGGSNIHGTERIRFESLFMPRVTHLPPRRILIRGQAGMGKSTLCKKIVHDYFRQGMWSDSYGRLLWVPLRSLKTKGVAGSKYSMEDWLSDVYFDDDADGRIFQEVIRTDIARSQSGTKDSLYPRRLGRSFR